ncbi:DsrE family protein [Sphingobacterium wenxiniae]|uniref:DsrE/DsrF/DrsH-like family protein n=1 Tax=Sphingobacterium wenxiniae TaxID=683125 RepID=A0A1I6UYL4_9SPHI|nr:DsrE family protein [Sphingobacterium wenxiniae]SFT06528.1 DsrE/DsrF/DrsH-like family protein [Sphingobacterium wenxiniae]
MKKQIIIIALFLLGITLFNDVKAQNLTTSQVENAIKKDGKYALLVQNSKHFMVSVMTGEEYKTKNTGIQFEIVLIGEVVKDLAEKEDLKPFIEKAQKTGVKIVVCEFAMEKLGVKKSQYQPSILTTPNGFTYLFGLQELGFKTITL